ncbi:MAG TPA: cupin domain-containing protein [Nocardioides sp.]|nr:cupin domain-containing protein [Nocardioides sp.]
MTPPPTLPRIVDALALPVPHDTELDVVAGSPTSGAVSLGVFGEVEIGVWESTPGVVRDIEAEEVFVVLSGEGEVRLSSGEALSLRPGVVVRLYAGERTEWEIRSTLRKVYLA